VRDAQPLRFFDCNVRLGRSGVPPLGGSLDLPGLLEEMAYFDIADSLAISTYAKEYRAEAGNRRLLDEVGGTSAIHPCWVLFPAHPGVDRDERAQVADMLASGARAARLYPSPTRDFLDEGTLPRQYALHPAVVAPLLEVLSAHRVPLLLEMDQVRWEEIYDICAAYPRVPVIVTDMHYSHKRSLFAGFARYENLRAELSGYHVHRGIEEVCAEFGAHRLLFGTRLPVFTPASTIAMIRYAAITADDRRKIAGDNLRALLDGVIERP